MGHYLACRIYDVDATLPFFLPFPSLVGTMGAVAEGGMVGAVMALVGAIIGAPGAAHVAEAAEPDRIP